MSIPGITINPYDELPFPTQPLPQSHPDRLAAVAHLFGIPSPPASRCRVLELGCATGCNIIPMADRFPESEFVGVDYSRSQLLVGERQAAQLQLSNLKLLHANLADLGNSLGQFDYIICHGVFSWVSTDLQDKILELCRSLLTPQGVGYISYNVYPGWHMRMSLRDMILSSTSDCAGINERLAKGREVLEFVAKAAAREATPYAQLLKADAETILKTPDGYIYHEYFEAENHPIYFHEFASRISRYDLQYLGETSLALMFMSNFGPHVEDQSTKMGLDLVATEQHLDVIANSGFRQSLVCHSNITPNRNLSDKSLEGLYFYGRMAPENPAIDLRATGTEAFQSPRGLTLSTSAPALKAALCYMNDQWPRAFTLDELLVAAGRLVGVQETAASRPPEAAREAFGQNLARCLVNGLIDANSAPDDFVSTISERPQASRLARLEAQGGNTITNRRHESVKIDDASRHILMYLDGQHDWPALLQELIEAVNRGDVSILVGGLPAKDGHAVAQILEQTLNQSLQSLAANSLLIA